MTALKIYVRLLDGAEAWVPIAARIFQDDHYEILNDPEFTGYDDSNYLFEFYPGDRVKTGSHTFSNNTTGLVATEIINQGEWPDRKFREFKFKATLGGLIINDHTARKYCEEIERVREEHSAGQFFYPTMIEAVNKLERFMTNDKE